MHNRIYPIQIKPYSEISTWGGWPEDVRPLLRYWNKRARDKGNKLTFSRLPGVFKCHLCCDFCEPHPNGAAEFGDHFYCDDCLIVEARLFLARLRFAGIKPPMDKPEARTSP